MALFSRLTLFVLVAPLVATSMAQVCVTDSDCLSDFVCRKNDRLRLQKE